MRRSTFGQSAVSLTLLSAIAFGICSPGIAQTPPQSNSTPTFQLDTAYRLGESDRVQIDVFGVEKYSGEYLVLADGTLNLRGVGVVRVGGLTIPEAQILISRQYATLLQQPVVTLTLVEPRPIQVAIAGEVSRPGSYTVTFEAGQQFPHVTDILNLAGGITQAANVREVRLRRAHSAESPIILDLGELVEQGNLSQNPVLLDGDSIFVPTATSSDPAQMRQFASTSLVPQAIDPVQVAVVGEVLRPGSYTVAPQATEDGNAANFPTLTRALQVAGGIQEQADIRQIELRRSTRSGLQVFTVNLWDLLQSGDITQDLFLQDGDTIVVPTAEAIAPEELETLASANFSPETINVNVVGEVVNPGAIQVPPNTPLNQALLAAGSFDPVRAQTGSVELIRLNPNGTVSRQTIPVDLASGVSPENNPVLRNNDVVVVKRSAVTSISDTAEEIFRPVRSITNIAAFFRIFF